MVGFRHQQSEPAEGKEHDQQDGTLTASTDGTAKLWDATGKEVRTFARHAGAVNALALSTDGKTLFTAGADATVRAWDVAKGAELRKFTADKPATAIQCLCLSADGKTLAIGADRGPIRLLDADTFKPVGESGGAGAFALVFAGNHVVARDAANAISVWDTTKKAEPRSFGVHGASVRGAPLAVSPDGKTIASVLGEEKGKPTLPVDLGLWDVETGKLLDRVQVGRRESEVTAIAYLPGGKAVAVGDAGGTVWASTSKRRSRGTRSKGAAGRCCACPRRPTARRSPPAGPTPPSSSGNLTSRSPHPTTSSFRPVAHRRSAGLSRTTSL